MPDVHVRLGIVAKVLFHQRVICQYLVQHGVAQGDDGDVVKLSHRGVGIPAEGHCSEEQRKDVEADHRGLVGQGEQTSEEELVRVEVFSQPGIMSDLAQDPSLTARR